MPVVRQYLSSFPPPEKQRSDKDRAQELFDRAARLRFMTREIMAMADEVEAQAMGLVGSTIDKAPPARLEGDTPSRGHLLEICKFQYGIRRLREQFFGKKLFGEPGWDMLLELYAGELTDERISTSNLILSSSAPNSTALRWLKYLEDAGLVTKKASHADGRVRYQRMTEDGLESMTRYFERISDI